MSLSWCFRYLVLALVGCVPTSLAAVEDFVPVNHTAGLCLWYGQCANVTAGALNCYSNTPARTVLKGSDVYTVLQEVCPWYINPTGDTKVCCDINQLNTLKTQVLAAQNFIARCPSCFTNFMKYFCATTCDPNGATFMNVKERNWNSTTNAIEQVDVAVLADFSSALYDSCKNVQSSQEGVPVIGFMCGTSAANCNGEKWLTFMGDPDSGSPTPFKFNYVFPNSTKPLDNGVIPLNASLIHCWDEDIYSRNLTCGCADCPGVCPVIPTHKAQTIPHILNINRNAFIVLMLVPFWVIFWACVIVFMFAFYCNKATEYKLVGEEDSSGECLSGECPSGECLSGLRSALLCPFMCVDWVGYHAELILKSIFKYWGLFAAYFWFVVLPVGFLICVGFSVGLIYFEVTTDPVQLWSSKGSDARRDKEYYDKNFNPFYRTEQIIITPVDKTVYPYFSITTPSGMTISKNMGPVFTKEVLREVLSIQNNVTNNLIAEFEDAGQKYRVKLSDICFKPVNEYCTIQSVLQYFQNKEELLNFTRGSILFLRGNWLSHIDYCVSNPSAINASDTYKPCLGEYGGPVDPNVALGGFPTGNDSTTSNYDNATALIVTFIVNNHLDPSLNKMAKAWELEFVKYLKEVQKNLTYINITFTSERSIEDEITRESNSDMVTIALSYGFMFLYVIVFIGGFRSVWTIPIDRLYLTGVAGVALVILAVTSSIGIMSYAGVTGSLIIIEVVPFLVLAVGVDNLFIIVHAYERCRKADPRMTINKCISRALSSVAPSVSLTAISESAAFLLGSVSPMPAVRTFSLYAGLAVFINFLLQISVFISILKLDMWIRETCTKAACKDLKESNIGCLRLLVKQYAKVLLHWSVRPFVIAFFGVTTLLSISLVLSGFEIGLNQNLALPKDSFLIPYFDDLYKYLHIGPPVYFVIEDGYNYSDPEKWGNICTKAGCSNESFGLQISLASREPNYSYIAEPAANWVDTYLAWISPAAKCCGYTEESGQLVLCELWNNTGGDCNPCINESATTFTQPSPDQFLRFLPLFKDSIPSIHCDQGGHAAFNTAIKMLDNNTVIGATYFMTYSTILKTSDDYVNSIRSIKRLTSQLSKSIDHPVFAYSVYFVFYEQYLTTGSLTIINLGASIGAVALMTFCLMRFSFGSTLIVVATVCVVILDMLALMNLLNISLNAVSLVNLVMTVGIAVEFCSHIVRWFYNSLKPTRLERAKDALEHMGTSVISGITITKFLGVFILLFAKSQLFEVFYFRMYMCMILTGVSHGLVLLPVVLSYIGPTPRWKPKNKNDFSDVRSTDQETINRPANGTSDSTHITSVPERSSLYPTLPKEIDEKTPLL